MVNNQSINRQHDPSAGLNWSVGNLTFFRLLQYFEICLVWHCPSSFLFSSFVDYLIKIPVLFHIFWIKWWRKKKRLRQRRLENSVQFLPWRKYRKTIFAHFSCSRLSMRHTSAPNVCNSWNLLNAVKLSHQCWFWYKCSLPFVGEKNVEHFNLSNCW